MRGGWLHKGLRILLIPPIYFLAAAIGWTILALPPRIDVWTALTPAVLGFAGTVWLLVLRLRFIRLYVFGHELTHWLAAKLYRRRTGRFRVGPGGGSVEVENPNTVILLAPYIVPVYSLALIGIYGIARAFVDPLPRWGGVVFCALLGATYAFHLVLTVLALKAGQQDLMHFGPIYSLGVILLGNVLLMFIALVVIGRQWGAAFSVLTEHMRVMMGVLIGLVSRMIETIRMRMG